MKTKETNTKPYGMRVLDAIKDAIEKLRKLGAKDIVVNGRKALYIPGNVHICPFYDVVDYGTYMASKKTHKHYLRHHKK